MDIKTLPIKNIKGNAGRSIGLLVLVAFLGFIIFAGSIVIGSMKNGLSSLEARLGADVIVVPGSAKSSVDLENMLLQGTPGYFYMNRSHIDQVKDTPGVEKMSAQLYLASASASCCSAAVQIIGFDPDTDFTISPWIQQSYKKELAKNDVVIGSDISQNSDGTIKLYDHECKVVAQLAKTGTGLDTAVYCNEETIAELIEASVSKGFNTVMKDEPANVVSSIYIKVADGYEPQQVADYINVHQRHVDAVRTKSMITGVQDSLDGLADVITLMMIMLWIMSFIILIVVFSMLARERKREFAILRMIGASRRMLAKTVMKESLLLGLAGGVLGVAVGALIVFPFSRAIELRLGMPFLLPGAAGIALIVLATVLVALVVGALAAAYSAYRLSGVDAATILREGN